VEGGKLALGKRALKVRTRSVDGIDKRESAHGPAGGGTMSITPISAAGLGQYVLQASNSAPLKQALQSLQTSLASGDLSGSQSAFQTLQTLYQNSATAGGTNLSSSSQLSTDLTALGTALTSGDLSTAQSAFATLQSDLKTSPSPSQTNETTAASQSLQLVQEVLGTLNSSTASSSANSTSALLDSVYGSGSSLNVLA
jgi:hypothetical protein